MKQDTYRRFAWIETCLLWSGWCSASDLGRTFGLARQNAQLIIDAYRQTHPGSLRYDAKTRRQVADTGFRPCYVRPQAEAFLDLLRAQTMEGYYLDQRDWTDVPFTDADRLIRPKPDADVVRAVVAALRHRQTLLIDYHAKKGTQQRLVSPHHLVFADNRYHVRAHCHVCGYPLDFVLTRIAAAQMSDEPWISGEEDHEWSEYVVLGLRLHPQLADEARSALLGDHPLDDEGLLRIRCRRALRTYVERQLTVVDAALGVPCWELVMVESPANTT